MDRQGILIPHLARMLRYAVSGWCKATAKCPLPPLRTVWSGRGALLSFSETERKASKISCASSNGNTQSCLGCVSEWQANTLSQSQLSEVCPWQACVRDRHRQNSRAGPSHSARLNTLQSLFAPPF